VSLNPYVSMPSYAFWKNGVEKSNPNELNNIHTPKFQIKNSDIIVTMGSCFAQHLANWMREKQFNLPFFDTVDNIKSKNFSANYGNVYTVRQCLQLILEVAEKRKISKLAWKCGDGYIDPLRPNVFITPFKTQEEVYEARKIHLNNVKSSIVELDVFIFTLGLTEGWIENVSATVLPVAPGVIGGSYDSDKYTFVNFRYGEIFNDLERVHAEILKLRNNRPFRSILTVSPIPLTATAMDQHILLSNTYSKATLRSVAGDFTECNSNSDYFPSYELITNPAACSSFYESNFRSTKVPAVDMVMKIFLSSCTEIEDHTSLALKGTSSLEDIDCEETLLNAFSQKKPQKWNAKGEIVIFGNSHLAGFKELLITDKTSQDCLFIPRNFLIKKKHRNLIKGGYRNFKFDKKYHHLVNDVLGIESKHIVFVGAGIFGDHIIRCHGSLRSGFVGCCGQDISPTLPIANKVDEKIVGFYSKKLKRRFVQIKQLEKKTSYQKIFWIVSPDMTRNTAEFLLGNEFVESKSYIHHKRAYEIAFLRLAKQLERIVFIYHDWKSLCDDSGFTLNQYRASNVVWDIHCNYKYYVSALNVLSTKS
jgi:GSCFA family